LPGAANHDVSCSTSVGGRRILEANGFGSIRTGLYSVPWRVSADRRHVTLVGHILEQAMLDHVSITVTDIATAEKFYDAIMGAQGFPKVRKSGVRLGDGKRCDAGH
jgi:hypothetical protein